MLQAYNYSNYWFTVLVTVVNVIPYIGIMLYLFDVKFPKPTIDVYNIIAVANVLLFIVLGANGFTLQALLAYSVMLWVILALGKRYRIDFATTIFLSVFSILAVSEMWEWTWTYTYGGMGNIIYEFGRQGPGMLLLWSTTPRLLCLPFLGWILWKQSWKPNVWMAWVSLGFMVWFLFYPVLTYPVFPFDWNWQIEYVIRLPTVAFAIAMMFGGLKRGLPEMQSSDV